MNRTEIAQLIQKTNGTRKHRTLSLKDGETFLNYFEQFKNNEKVHTIRVYSSHGFVPHSYKWRAEICALEAHRSSEGEWLIYGKVVDAKRAFGQASLVTINSRPVSEYLK